MVQDAGGCRTAQAAQQRAALGDSSRQHTHSHTQTWLVRQPSGRWEAAPRPYSVLPRPEMRVGQETCLYDAPLQTQDVLFKRRPNCRLLLSSCRRRCWQQWCLPPPLLLPALLLLPPEADAAATYAAACSASWCVAMQGLAAHVQRCCARHSGCCEKGYTVRPNYSNDHSCKVALPLSRKQSGGSTFLPVRRGPAGGLQGSPLPLPLPVAELRRYSCCCDLCDTG